MGAGQMQRRIAAVVCASAIAVAGLWATPALASSQESRFTYLTNHERSSRGIRTLAVMGDLVAIARRHSEQMAARGTIYHNNDLPNEVSGNWTMLGENVGKGQSVDSIHDAFMNSPEHRANILRTAFNQVGIGTAVKDGYIYVTEVFAERGSSPHTTVRRTPRRSARPARGVPHRSAPKHVAPAGVEPPRTVSVLIILVGLDARTVSPVTGAALGV
jgi:cysteine-rich secretory family protein